MTDIVHIPQLHYTYEFEEGYYVVYRVSRDSQWREVAKYDNPQTAAYVSEMLTMYADDEVGR